MHNGIASNRDASHSKTGFQFERKYTGLPKAVEGVEALGSGRLFPTSRRAIRRAAASAVESLESRRLLASIVVTSLDDNTLSNGSVTLREAVEAAETDTSVDGSTAGAGPDTITFDPALTAGGDATVTLGIFDTGQDNTEFGPTAFLISSNITIQGPAGDNGITIRRDTANTNVFRLFHVRSSSTLTLENLTLSGGLARGGSGAEAGGGAAGFGGAVFNQGTLNVTRSTLSGNSAVGGNAENANGSLLFNGGGGGVGGDGTSGGYGGGPNGGAPNTATNYTDPGNPGGFGGGGGGGGGGQLGGNGGFGGGGGGGDSNNGGVGGFGGGGGGGGGSNAGGFGGGTGLGASSASGGRGGGGAGLGGAVFNESGSVKFTNSTLSNNISQGGNAGGASTGRGTAGGSALFSRNGSVTLLNTTVAYNTVTAATLGDANPQADEGSVYLLSDGAGNQVAVSINNTIVSDTNTGNDFVAAAFAGGITPVFTGVNNLIESNAGVPAAVITQSSDPKLGGLLDNGGPTRTRLPGAGSPAFNNGNNTAASALSTDQRGLARIAPAGGTIDIGSVEEQNSPPPPPPAPTLSISDVTMLEGDSGTKEFVFTVTRTGGTITEPVTFEVNTADGTAISPTDYQGFIDGTGSFGTGPGAGTELTFSVMVNGDTTVEPDETFFVNISNPVGATIVKSKGLGTIQNDDTPPPGSVAAGDVSTAEGDAGLKPLVFTVTRSGDASQAASVDYYTDNATAIAGLDYQPVSGTLNFLPNQTSKIVVVQIIGDTAVEADETFFLKLASPGNVLIADVLAEGVIINDDVIAPPPPPAPLATAMLGPDPGAPGKTSLIITGTDNGEYIDVDPGSSSSKLKVEVDDVLIGEFNTNAFDRIYVYAKGGADRVSITTSTTKTAVVFGGDGADQIKGGNGKDILLGEADGDIIRGRRGRDFIIGGAGADGISGDEDDDLIIAAATTFDADLAALFAFQKEWTSSNSYTTRRDNVRNGTGGNVGGRKINNTSILEDKALDLLSGNSGRDLFFYHKTGSAIEVADKINDKASDETAVDSN